MPSPGHPSAAPLTAPHSLSMARRVSAAIPTRDAERSTGARGGRQSPGVLAKPTLLRCNWPTGVTPCGRALCRAGGWT